MIGHSALILNEECGESGKQALSLMARINLKPRDTTMVAGSMFICRASLMQPLKTVFNESEFEPTLAR